MPLEPGQPAGRPGLLVIRCGTMARRGVVPWYLAMQATTVPYPAVPYRTLPCSTLPYPTFPVPYHTLPSSTLPYPTFPVPYKKA